MVETTTGEAKILIAMLQLLIQEWYGERHKRQCRLEAIRSLVQQATKENVVPSVEKAAQASANSSGEDGSESSSPSSPESKDVSHIKPLDKMPLREIKSKDV